MKKMLFVSMMAVCLATAVKAQDRMVVVTTSGGLYDFPITENGGLKYDAETGGFILVSEGETKHFGADDINVISIMNCLLRKDSFLAI